MKYLWSISLVLVVLLGNVLFIFQDVWFFDRQFSQLWSYERQESVMDEAKLLMQYRKNDDVLIASDVYTQAEKEHLYDVKKIIIIMKYLLLASSLLLLILSFLLYCRWFFGDLRSFALLRMTMIWFVFFVLCLLFFAFVAWDWFFDLFHRTFFVDNWLFSADSFLIQSYPWEFFRNAMVVMLLRSGVGLWLILWLLLLIEKKPRRA
jgi:integral membrane protein (TIGR01906 family)